VRGKFAKEQGGKVTTVYRRRYCVHIDRIVKEKANGAQVRRCPARILAAFEATWGHRV
jgi:hypothetical protein